MLIKTEQIERKIDEYYADLANKINQQPPDGKQSIALEFIEQQRLADRITLHKFEEILERIGIQEKRDIDIDINLKNELSRLGI